ncbi:hypothetical protein [Dyella sp.]|uniref:hypothetical protein n=1 Tax=Dyella sp. TaxID=1869338 RepID=UPI002ED48F35
MRRFFLSLAAWLVATAALADTATTDSAPPECVSFARPFYLIARNRDRGVTKVAAMANVKRSRGEDNSPGMPDNWMTMTVTTVYNYPAVPPEELQARAQRACSLDAEGKVQFRGI